MDNGVGERIRVARGSREMSQAELANAVGISNSYLSHLEAGRRPPNRALRLRIAGVLGIDVAQLETGVPADLKDELRLKLRFAELALRNGDWAMAADAFAEVAQAAHGLPLEDFAVEAAWGRARALEATGALEDAVEAYEELVSRARLSPAVPRLLVLVALIRASSECGDLARAIDLGEQTMRDLPSESGPTDVAAVAELVSTLSGCYVERGDLTRAQQLTRHALELADQDGSARARAAAAWNAAVVAEARFDITAAQAYADRALAIYSELDHARAVGLLRVVAAALLLRLQPPDPRRALVMLRQAHDELSVVGTQLDLSYARTEEARALVMSGDTDEARAAGHDALDLTSGGDRLHRGRVLLVLGHVARAGGDVGQALEMLHAAAEQLRSAGANRQAAIAWRELGESYADLGQTESALDALRTASDLAGATYRPLLLGLDAAAGDAVSQ